MQEKGKQDDGFGPFSICQRLFNFIMNSILTRGTMRVTLGASNTTSPQDDETRAFEASHTSQDTSPQDDKARAFEVSHTSQDTSPQDDKTQAFKASHMGQDQATRPDGHELLVEFRHTNGSMVNKTNNPSSQAVIQETKNPTQTRKQTSPQDQGKVNGDRDKSRKKSTLPISEGGNLPGRKHHLLSVASNINEKADAFIRSRKEAMEKTLKQERDK
ncbi:hypothetical protein HanXRQr2_Chr01g0002931 [Helianthus annuus]|uniref:Uncharacterized protein n=1 Tax=Helianthus annuus TaxID=4232 RepID=A0A9K3JTY5_HELAN|nr:hypothetical protein HanXRQr2_Chr01g0002931 [Helianthus annuus]KAJ0620963.1 hypothetical protein HanIR_Chr01g0003291 [Helianthus annuus]